MSAFQEYCRYWIDYSKGSKSIKEQLDIQQKLYEKAVIETRAFIESSVISNNKGE